MPFHRTLQASPSGALRGSDAAAVGESAGSRVWAYLGRFVRSYGILLFLTAVILLVAVLEPSFVSYHNIMNVIRQVSMGGIMACGMTFIIISGAIDLSVGAIFTLSSCVLAIFLKSLGAYPTILLAIVVAVGVTCLNGVILAKIGGDLGTPFIVTFGMKTVIYALALIITGGFHYTVPETRGLSMWGKGTIGGVPVPAIVFILIMLICLLILQRSTFGRKVYFLGGNREAARLSGINVGRIRILTFLISGVCTGVASVIMVSRIGGTTPTIGYPYDFDVLTMVILGGVMLGGGKGSMLNAFLGMIVIGVLTNAMNILNISANPQMIAKGFLILFAVWFDTSNRNKSLEGLR